MSVYKKFQALKINSTVSHNPIKSKFICISNLNEVDAAFYQPILGCSEAITLDLNLSVFDNIVSDFFFEPAVITNLGYLSDKYHIEDLLRRQTITLTAYEQMRVKIVKSVIQNNAVVVFTNPTKGLDMISSRIICKYLKDLTKESKTVIVFSTHPFVKEYSDINYQLIDFALVSDN